MVNDKNNFKNSENDSFGDLFSQSSNKSEGLDFSLMEDSVNDALHDSSNDLSLDNSEDDNLGEPEIVHNLEDDTLVGSENDDMFIDDSLVETDIVDNSEDDTLVESEGDGMFIDDSLLASDKVDNSEDDTLVESEGDDMFIDDSLVASDKVNNSEDDSLEALNFNLPKNTSSVIKVIGVGGGGSNAVNHMVTEGIKGVDFVICNTDAQALEMGQAPTKIQLGISLTEGLGAGENPTVGEEAAFESEDEIRNILKNNTKMVFVTAGMGGGTGTGAAPVIAQICKDLDILTIGIVTVPFGFEGPKRFKQAQEGIDKMRKYVDSLVVINNDKLVEVYGDLGLRSGFAKADETLMVAARGIAEVITKNCLVNIDLNDAKTVLKNSGTAIMGYGKASGPNRAEEALVKALDSPLLNDNHIKGANKILLLILSGKDELTINEHAEINQYLQREAGGQANIILGVGDDSSLDEDISITIIATGVLSHDVDPITGFEQKKIHVLDGSSDNMNQESSTSNPLDLCNNNEMELDSLQNDNQVNSEVEIKEETKIKNVLNFNSDQSNHIQSNSILRDKIINDDLSSLSEKNIQIAEDRKKRLQKFHNLNFQNQIILKELEDEPAYKRQGLELDQVEHSSSSSTSRFFLDSSSDDLEIKNNNSFLHDNVD
tara:strand:- start:1258 stop:3231 length:1974 start_codon:yes stop_codon:yes gene_type:complete